MTCVGSHFASFGRSGKGICASRIDADGVLILSRFTGAARELTDALLVIPFAIGEIADSIASALGMSGEERTRRLKRMRRTIAESNIYDWATKFLTTLLGFDRPVGLSGT